MHTLFLLLYIYPGSCIFFFLFSLGASVVKIRRADPENGFPLTFHPRHPPPLPLSIIRRRGGATMQDALHRVHHLLQLRIRRRIHWSLPDLLRSEIPLCLPSDPPPLLSPLLPFDRAFRDRIGAVRWNHLSEGARKGYFGRRCWALVWCRLCCSYICFGLSRLVFNQ